MANKRVLKKRMKCICEELFVDFVAASLYGNNSKQTESEAILFSIVKLQNNNISRISHPEPGMPAKTYFRDLKEQFNKQVSEILDHINYL